MAGEPIPKGRPRTKVVTPKGGRPFAQIYTDEQTRDWEERVVRYVQDQLRRLAAQDDGQELALPFRGRVLVSLRFNLAKPKSYSASVTMPVTSRSDVDNLAKAVLDALQNAQVLANDNIVTDLVTCKRYADEEHPVGVEVDLTGWIS